MTVRKIPTPITHLPLLHSTDGIIIFNMMGIAIDANMAAAELLNGSRNDIVSRGYSELFRNISTGSCLRQITYDIEKAMNKQPVFSRYIMADIACRQLEYDCIPINLHKDNTCNTLIFLTFRALAAKTEYPLLYQLPESA